MNIAEFTRKQEFLALFQQYEQDIYRMAYVYVKNKDDALDVVQETAYRSYLKFATLQDIHLFKTWIIRITMNCAVDLLRKNKKVVHLQTDIIEGISKEQEDIPLTLTLQDLLNILNEDEKTIVLLKFYQEYTFQEISDFLHTPLSTVKSVLYRALQKLRKETRRVDLYGQ